MMNPQKKDVVIIGGGPAGLAAAVEMRKQGIEDIVILERERFPGGILRQCIHDGFGLIRFKASMSGPEYAQKFIDEAEALGIEWLTETTVLSISPGKQVKAVSPNGLVLFQAKAVVLAMGCRERSRGAISIPGDRPAGVYTAGVAQAYINLQNTMVGQDVMILGSGDIGMIMARRLTLEGARVKGVFEIQPYPSGLVRNIEQCLNDYNIPLFLSHTVTQIKGKERLTGITVSRVDENLKIIPGTEQDYSCDTLILSVGLIPENELSLSAGVQLDPRTNGPLVDENLQTNVAGIFAAGNVLHVHDLVDSVSLEAEKMAGSVIEFLAADSGEPSAVSIMTDGMISSAVPQRISGRKKVTLALRVRKPLRNCEILVFHENKIIAVKKMRKAVPAEMIMIEVDPEGMNLTDQLKVEVKC